MKGSFEVVVKNRRIQYKFTISRNITILKGDSATGKTTLIDMIQAFQNDADSSGVSITSSCPCVVIVEDSNSGFQFFNHICSILKIPCISSGSKSKIYSTVLKSSYDNIMIIADGAAFGAEIENVLSLSKVKNIGIYLPESFEWLIFNSNLIKGNDIPTILENPSDYIESQKYFSWELFFTDLLKKSTHGTYLEYSKKKLNEAYLQDNEMKAIIKNMPKIF